MQLNFTGRNLEVTPALKTFTQEKLQRVEKRYNNISNVHVIFQIEKLAHIAEATVHLDNSEIHAKAEAEDMYTAVDKLVDKLLGQITKLKEKHADHR